MAINGLDRFPHGHNDLVLAMSFNLYGTRVATASSDHRMRVWDLDEKTQKWNITDTWTAHHAEVSEVKWNAPQVGEILGTIGEDGLLKVWMEDVSQAVNSGRRFKQIYQQVSVTGVPYMSIDFKNLGNETYMAFITRDGHLSVCVPDDHDDLSSWHVMWTDYMCKTPPRTEETGFRLSWHKESLPAWPAILTGLDRRSLSLAVAIGHVVKIFRTDKDRKFYTAATLEGARDLVRDVGWANGSMRGFDTLATASKDGFVRIYELHTPGATSLSTVRHSTPVSQNHTPQQVPVNRPAPSGIGAGLAGNVRGRRDDSAGVPGAIKQDVKLVAELETHNTASWRVSWSPAGDVLISTGDDGLVRLWKKGIDGKWLEMAEIDATRDR